MFRKILNKVRKVFQSNKEKRHELVGPGKLWKMKREFQINFLKKEKLEEDHYFLDLGCGTLRGGIPLIDFLECGHYYGVERRDEVLDEGRKELEEAGLADKKPVLLVSPDISQLSVDQEFDFIWAFSVLIHMSDEILSDALGFVSKNLSDTGVFYANVNIGERQTGNWQGFPVVSRSFDFYSDECARKGLKVSQLGTLEMLGHSSNDKFSDSQVMLKISKKI